jgi:hypothetical protein
MLEAYIIEHVVKYKILEKMVSSPKWHCAQLFDIMAMVDTYGLPHLFFTFSSNETLEFKWSDISNMETFSKDLLVKKLLGKIAQLSVHIYFTQGYIHSRPIISFENGIK